MLSYIPMLYQAVYDHSPLRSGVDMLPFILSSVITTTSSAMVLSRTGHYWGILVGGPVFVLSFDVRVSTQHVVARFCCISGGFFFTVTENTSSMKLIIYQILCGMGIGECPCESVHHVTMRSDARRLNFAEHVHNT